MIAPRPVFIEQGRLDRVAHWQMSQKAFAEVQDVYAKLKIPDRALYSIFEGDHVMHGTQALEFFDRWLKSKIYK
jgi:hypothetical protein